MAFDGTGPTQPVMGLELGGLPSALLMVNVPQNANEVRTDPVELLMAIVKSEVRVAPAIHVTQPVPVIEALTSSKSLEVHLLGLGKFRLWASTLLESISPATMSSKQCSQPVAIRLGEELGAKGRLVNLPCQA